MFGAHYFGQNYYAQANAGGGQITQFPIPQLANAYSVAVSLVRRVTGAVSGFLRTTARVG